MNVQTLFIKIGNPFVKLILRSPLHGLLSQSTMLVTFTGRKSGRVFTTPTSYLRDGDTLTVVSLRERTWWRNLRGGASVTVRLQGRNVKGRGVVIEETREVAAALMAYLLKMPQYAGYFQVTLDSNGQPNVAGVNQAAQTRVVIQIELRQ